MAGRTKPAASLRSELEILGSEITQFEFEKDPLLSIWTAVPCRDAHGIGLDAAEIALGARGYIKVNDRRVRIVALTPRGKDLIVSAFRKLSGQMKRVLCEPSPE